MRGPRSLRGATGHKARSGKLCIEGCYVRAGVAVGRTRVRKQQAYSRLEACGRRRQEVVRAREVVLCRGSTCGAQ